MDHKTLYIDVDEEITSIIDRVRKAQAGEVIIVVPKQALLIQSLVNLKLLKKEADRRKKRVMIVTQDKIGKKLIEKAGILVQKKATDNIADESDHYISEKEEKRKKFPAILSRNRIVRIKSEQVIFSITLTSSRKSRKVI